MYGVVINYVIFFVHDEHWLNVLEYFISAEYNNTQLSVILYLKRKTKLHICGKVSLCLSLSFILIQLMSDYNLSNHSKVLACKIDFNFSMTYLVFNVIFLSADFNHNCKSYCEKKRRSTESRVWEMLGVSDLE